jgi:hypothetical protein
MLPSRRLSPLMKFQFRHRYCLLQYCLIVVVPISGAWLLLVHQRATMTHRSTFAVVADPFAMMMMKPLRALPLPCLVSCHRQCQMPMDCFEPVRCIFKKINLQEMILKMEKIAHYYLRSERFVLRTVLLRKESHVRMFSGNNGRSGDM